MKMSTTKVPRSTDWSQFEARRQKALADCAALIVLQRRIVAMGKEMIDTYERSQGER
jgi:hypothetical protein